MSYIESAVPLTELARVMKVPVTEVEAECRALSVFVGADWARRPAIEQRDAAKIVDGSERRQQEHDRAWRDHLAATEQWERDRNSAQQAAHDTAWRAAGGPRGGQLASQAGREAAAAAVQTYERQNPLPTFGGAATGQSWLKRAADVLTGVAQGGTDPVNGWHEWPGAR